MREDADGGTRGEHLAPGGPQELGEDPFRGSGEFLQVHCVLR